MRQKQKQQAIIYILLTAFFFATMSLFVRLSGDLPTMQKAFFRNVIAAAVGLYLTLKSGSGLKMKGEALPDLLGRCIFGTTGVLANFYAVDHMNLADASMLQKLAPFFAIIASYFLLREKANAIQWSCVGMAFIGALCVMKPSFDISSASGLVAMLGGAAAGFAYTFVRRLGKKGVAGPVIVLYFSTFSCLITLPKLLFDYAPMTGQQTGFLLMAGIMAAGGQLCVTKAYQLAPAKETSVYDYFQILYSAVYGILLFGEVPDLLSVIGYCIIISVAVFSWRYNLKRD